MSGADAAHRRHRAELRMTSHQIGEALRALLGGVLLACGFIALLWLAELVLIP